MALDKVKKRSVDNSGAALTAVLKHRQDRSAEKYNPTLISIIKLSPEQIVPSIQVRQTISEHEIRERERSLREVGQLQPITVGPLNTDGKYPLLLGQCRWLAAQRIAGFKLDAVINATLARENDAAILISQITENDQRSALKMLELAAGLKLIIDADANINQEALAQKLGWISQEGKPNSAKVSRILSLLKMPQAAKDLINDGLITDMLTADTLRKVADINPSEFQELCAIARHEEGLTRKQVTDVYRRCKAIVNDSTSKEIVPSVGNNTIVAPTANTPTTQGASRQAGTNDSTPGSKRRERLHAIAVNVDGVGSGRLCLYEASQTQTHAWVDLDDGYREHVALKRIQLVSLNFK